MEESTKESTVANSRPTAERREWCRTGGGVICCRTSFVSLRLKYVGPENFSAHSVSDAKEPDGDGFDSNDRHSQTRKKPPARAGEEWLTDSLIKGASGDFRKDPTSRVCAR